MRAAGVGIEGTNLYKAAAMPAQYAEGDGRDRLRRESELDNTVIKGRKREPRGYERVRLLKVVMGIHAVGGKYRAFHRGDFGAGYRDWHVCRVARIGVRDRGGNGARGGAGRRSGKRGDSATVGFFLIFGSRETRCEEGSTLVFLLHVEDVPGRGEHHLVAFGEER